MFRQSRMKYNSDLETIHLIMISLDGWGAGALDFFATSISDNLRRSTFGAAVRSARTYCGFCCPPSPSSAVAFSFLRDVRPAPPLASQSRRHKQLRVAMAAAMDIGAPTDFQRGIRDTIVRIPPLVPDLTLCFLHWF